MRASNENATCVTKQARSPFIVLHTMGDGSQLYRTLARVLVRRELKIANAIPDHVDCEPTKAAG
jgi:hypothetical protein